MNRNPIEDQWRQCHWEQWREVRARWRQLRASWAAREREPRGAKTAAFEGHHGRYPTAALRCDSRPYGTSAGGPSFSRVLSTKTVCKRTVDRTGGG